MIASMNIDDFKLNNTYIGYITKNNIIENANYYPIIYSDENVSFNSIYITLKFEAEQTNSDSNSNIISKIHNIEKQMIDKINYGTKTPKLKIENHIKYLLLNDGANTNTNTKTFFTNMNIDINTETKTEKDTETKTETEKDTDTDGSYSKKTVYKYYLVKISGIWETSEQVGLIYKIFKCQH